ncbi:MAG: response regulator transcription factor [Rhizobiales bacterium]|nr:response regulator transcription factor [Hyphomicrobiales bacterium]
MDSHPRFGLTTGDGRPPRVAIVDANPASSMVSVALVRQFGCMAVVATGGEAALSLLRRDGSIDLVILDLGTSDREGLVLAQLIRTLGDRGTMPIIGLAAGPRLPGRAAGFSASLKKPYSPRELHAVMRDALDRARAVMSGDR